jgi:UDP-3-O-[3-hydroxymyristoyl] N-acetylglucosamine deacetylase
MHEKTLRRPCEIRGIGLHTGQEARIVIYPAPPRHGISFRVKRRFGDLEIPARAQYVKRTKLSTCLGRWGTRVCTVEHLMSAFVGLELDNAVVEVWGGEVPVMDGSAMPLVEAMRATGFAVQPVAKRYIRVLEPVVIEQADRSAALLPCPVPIFDFEIRFNHPAIDVQTKRLLMTPRSFVTEIAPARTFGFEEDLARYQRENLSHGVSLDNCVGLGSDGRIMNPEGLRYPDEFVRHKILDAIGDLAMAGSPLLAEYRGIKAGHALNHSLVMALLDRKQAWEWIEAQELGTAEAV